MKKILMTGVAALALCAGFTSCSNHDIEPMTQAEIDKAKYETAFLNYVGGKIDKNQDWGFGTSKTRGTTRAAEFGWEVSSDYTATFGRQYYDDVFTYLPEYVKAEGKLTNYEFVSRGPFEFSIIYAQTSGVDEVGYYYYNPEDGIESKKEVVFVENIQNLGDYVQVVWDGETEWKGMGTGDGDNMWNGSWGKTVTDTRAKVFTINVPAGYRMGFFIHQIDPHDFTGYSNSMLNNCNNQYYSAVVDKDGDAYLVGLEDWDNIWGNSDLDCNDVIIAVSGEKKPVPVEAEYDLRIIAEDLSATEASDFDFNDVVFDVKYGNPATIKIHAAGGTLPLYINGQEVHGLLGAETTEMVNTNAGVTRDPVVVELNVEVKDAAEANEKIVIQVEKNGAMQTLTAEQGKPAAKLGVGTDYQWLDERASVKAVYPSFLDWVNGSGFTQTPWQWWY